MKTRIPSLALAVSLLAGGLVSCGGGSGNAETAVQTVATAEAVTTEAVTEYKPPEYDFQGYTFRFLNGNTSYKPFELCVEELTGESLNDAIYNRNKATETRYNITLAETISKSPQADFSNGVIAGDDSFDVATLRMEWAMPVTFQGQTLPWNDIGTLHLDSSYWVQGSLKAFSFANKVYFAVSAFDITHYDSVRAFAFNKKICSDLQMTSPYTLIREGKWTLDKLEDMSLAAAQDLDGDGEWTTADRYGIISYSNVIANTMMAGVGSILSIGKDKDDMPYFDLDTEKHVNSLMKVSAFFADREKNGIIYRENKQDIFRAGQALFMCSLINEVAALRDMDDDFGIISAPKLDEKQENYINLGGSPFFTTIPVTQKDTDRTGAILDALAFDSVGVIDTAYYDILLKGKTSRDEESAEMLDLIFSTLAYYHPVANSYLNAPLADQYLWYGKTDFASYFASVKDKINAEIADAISLAKK